MTDTDMPDRGFVHDVNVWQDDYDADNPTGWNVVVYRLEEEDGIVMHNTGPIVGARFGIRVWDPKYLHPDGWYTLETDDDLPTWAGDIARDWVNASYDTEAYKAHAAAWLN